MSDVTRILVAIEQGDAKAADELLPLVYEELRRLAAQKMSPSSLMLLNTSLASLRRTASYSSISPSPFKS